MRTVLLLSWVATLSAMAVTPEENSFFSQSTIASHEDGFNHALPCVARLNNGRLLAVWSRYKPGASDFAVVGAFSADGGCGWSNAQVLIDNAGLLDADPNIIVGESRVLVTCTTVDFSGGIRTSATWCVRSDDHGKTWQPAFQIPMGHTYTCGKCQRGLVLNDGAWLIPYSWDVLCEQGKAHQTEGEMDLRAGVMRSTDNGQTWFNGSDVHADYQKVAEGAVAGLDEPAVVALEDGSLYMLMRSGGTHLFEARSTDGGVTWTDPRPSPLTGTNAPASLCRFTHGAHSGVCVVWDNSRERFPLCAAASFDGCRTWSPPKDIAFPYTGGQASYPSCDQAADGALVVVWQQDVAGGRDVRMARFSPAWLVGDPAPMMVVLFGESTTAPRGPLRVFGQLLSEGFSRQGRQVNVVNMGKGGENTRQARERFGDVLAQLPRYVTIYYGLNDAAVDVWKGESSPRVPKEEFAENLRFFVRELKAKGATPILMTPNPLAWTVQEVELYGKPPYDPASPDGHNVLVREYAQACRSLAEEEHVPLVDVFGLFEECAKSTGYAPLLLDGVHPSEYGHRIIADALTPLITQ